MPSFTVLEGTEVVRRPGWTRHFFDEAIFMTTECPRQEPVIRELYRPGAVACRLL
ncbi:MAG: hypothetical protein SF187_30780 [Deltaproteobacteria bacterium]|nr:hypothetical protein [Deltaproteobacteria bacterium]